ncbi:hypothetical protein Sste5346_010257 [Sporothrix stenoceras]|uniref:3-dehydroquinate dehydratase n=1 Tax=Sporothrix stenoceras TaxID=5173 RepID=A0ABR3YHR4_9PEZI
MSPNAQQSSVDVVFDNYANNKQTFIIPLTFTDVTDGKDVLERIGYGGDVWELRVDLLSPTPQQADAVNLPPLSYVKDQLHALQAMSPKPILFTIRTKSQGGKFPDDAVKEALDLMLLAVENGVAYIDVEVEWPESLLSAISAKKGASKLVASYHSWTGKVAWTSQELMDKFDAANAFGDIIKLSILSATIEDCTDLSLFVRHYRLTHTKPLLAVGMGANGQLSRITSPISLVTHKLIPSPSAPGQLSLAQVHQARHLIGQLPKQQYAVTGTAQTANVAAQALEAAFAELGYPYTCVVQTSTTGSVLDVTALKTIEDAATAVGEAFIRLTGRPAPVSVILTSLSSWP